MSNQRIPSIDPSTATGSNKKHFEMFTTLGGIPNMVRAMAQSPAVLDGYVSLHLALGKGSLGRRLREQLALTVAGTNHCEYCASAHTVLGKMDGLSEADTIAALNGNAEGAEESAALKFAKVIVEKRGRIDDADFKEVIDVLDSHPAKWAKLSPT
jgi:AhpD family alkylhydroperoxidase